MGELPARNRWAWILSAEIDGRGRRVGRRPVVFSLFGNRLPGLKSVKLSRLVPRGKELEKKVVTGCLGWQGSESSDLAAGHAERLA